MWMTLLKPEITGKQPTKGKWGPGFYI